MYLEYLECGMAYTWGLASSQGASFTLFPEPGYTPDDIKKAKAEIHHTRDAVSIRIADEWDLNDKYKSEIFRHPLVRSLPWYQITQEENDLSKARKAGLTVEEYVQSIVLPNVEKAEKYYLARSGPSIYTY